MLLAGRLLHRIRGQHTVHTRALLAPVLMPSCAVGDCEPIGCGIANGFEHVLIGVWVLGIDYGRGVHTPLLMVGAVCVLVTLLLIVFIIRQVYGTMKGRQHIGGCRTCCLQPLGCLIWPVLAAARM